MIMVRLVHGKSRPRCAPCETSKTKMNVMAPAPALFLLEITLKTDGFERSFFGVVGTYS